MKKIKDKEVKKNNLIFHHFQINLMILVNKWEVF